MDKTWALPAWLSGTLPMNRPGVRPAPDPADERHIAEKWRGVAPAVAQEYERINCSPGIQ